LEDIERRRARAEQARQELERQLASSREQLAILEGRLDRAAPVELELADVRERLEALELRLKHVDSVAPPLPAGGVCPKCGSSQRIGRAKLSVGWPAGRSLTATVDSPMAAGIFSGYVEAVSGIRSSAEVWAEVCGRCGHAELNVDSPSTLLEAWKVSAR
jgi:hypothetical protein